MAVKMPVLGESSRRRRRSPWTRWLFLAAVAAAAGYGWRWRADHRQAPPAAPGPSAPLVAAPPPAVPQPDAASAEPARAGPQRLAVRLDGALETALVQVTGRQAGPALAQVVKRLLVWWMRVPADLQRGDRLGLLYEERPGEEPLVLAVRFSSTRLQRTLEAFRFQPASSPVARYYLADGQELELRIDPSPLDTYEQVTSHIKDGRGHKGVDFKTPVGTPVKATFDGTLTRKNWFFRGNGNSLEVTETTPPHRKALFLHLWELPRSLRPGMKFTRGEVIARSGNSGHSFAPHLHYQLESADGRVLDPFLEHATRRETLPEADRAAFDALVASERAALGPDTGESAASSPRR
jgi:murein DD-endopeptidase